MAKKRVHEIAKSQGMTSKEVLAKLQAAGLEVKAAASSVEEADALEVLNGNGARAHAAGGGGSAAAEEPASQPAAPKADGQAAKPAATTPRPAEPAKPAAAPMPPPAPQAAPQQPQARQAPRSPDRPPPGSGPRVVAPPTP